ncbi:hypothetical protein LSTR_LSTR004151 [Laodelphax striatellus]|uniref:Uncharacterized protein n=1 Tax=Laodelphax striatellus TaxID=195883 RepID=A0A482X9B8_LAOST|nr:hypothetical protein LSTR_LSTR004151 [Laodelphax striatellus]
MSATAWVGCEVPAVASTAGEECKCIALSRMKKKSAAQELKLPVATQFRFRLCLDEKVTPVSVNFQLFPIGLLSATSGVFNYLLHCIWGKGATWSTHSFPHRLGITTVPNRVSLNP